VVVASCALTPLPPSARASLRRRPSLAPGGALGSSFPDEERLPRQRRALPH
jgi:hypothetical protein